MHTILKQNIYAFFLFSLLLGVGLAVVSGVQAADPAPANVFKLQFADNSCASGSGPQTGNASGGVWSSWFGDSDTYDADCVRIFQGVTTIPPKTDIRICVQAKDDGLWGIGGGTGSAVCGPWASSGGGWGAWTSDNDAQDPDEWRIRVETQDMSANITDMRLSIQVADTSSGGGCTNQLSDIETTPYASEGGGWSDWAIDTDGENFNCLRINLETISVPLADLVPSGLTFGTFTVGESSDVSYSVHNVGATSSRATSSARLLFNYNPSGSSWNGTVPCNSAVTTDDFCIETPIPTLATGAQQNVHVDASIATAGLWSLQVVVDPSNTVEEIESNNTSEAITFTVAANQSPSATLFVSPSIVAMGSTSQLTWSLSNVSSCTLEGTLVSDDSVVDTRSVNAAYTQVVLTSGTQWTVPADWNYSYNTIEVIGGGGGGYKALRGGGGGAYSKISNVSLSPGGSVGYSVGIGANPQVAGQNGGDTWFCNSTSNCASILGGSVVVGAKGGLSGGSGFLGVGGQSSAGVGSVKNSGGNGGVTGSNAGAGGGGAGGKNGDGQNGGNANGGQAGGGGGSGGGTPGSNGTSSVGGNGGNNASGTGGGSGGNNSNGASGSNGGGGGGGDTDRTGGAGGAGNEWGTGIGSGGGGGGAGHDSNAAAGGNYGGGGGAKGDDNSGASASGAQGVIVIRYLPRETHTSIPITESVMYTLSCLGTNGATVTSERTISVESTDPPELTYGGPGIVEVGYDADFSWNLNGNTGCIFVGPGVPASVSGAANPFTVDIQGQSEFQIQCNNNQDSEIIRINVVAKVFET